MRILLVQPKIDPRVRSLGKFEPLPLEILGATLNGHQVRIFDYRFEKDLGQELRSWRPDVVGVTALTVEYRSAVSVIEEVRAFSPDTVVVVGGTHATMVPEDFLLPGVSAIAIGLGHETFRELIEAVDSGNDFSNIKGLALPEQGGLTFTESRVAEESFERIPNPDRTLTRKYRAKYKATFAIGGDGVSISTIGCPGRCSFCSSWSQNNGKYLERDAASAVEDILSIPEKYVMLADDNSLYNIERAWEIARLLGRSKIRKSIRTYARADIIRDHPDLLRALKAVGLHALIVGYEAVTDARLRQYAKGNTVETNRAAIKVLREVGIENRAMFVIAPDFTKENFEEIFQFIESEGIRTPLFTVLTPLPGTPFFNKVRGDLLTEEYGYFDFTHCVLPTTLPYMAFYEAYINLYHRTNSIRRYLRDWYLELKETLESGARPKTERRNISLAEALFLKYTYRYVSRSLRADYAKLSEKK